MEYASEGVRRPSGRGESAASLQDRAASFNGRFELGRRFPAPQRRARSLCTMEPWRGRSAKRGRFRHRLSRKPMIAATKLLRPGKEARRE